MSDFDEITSYGPLHDMEDSEVPSLVGKRIVNAQHLTSDVSDSDERVWFEFDDGTELLVTTSEWLHVQLKQRDAQKASA